MSTPCFDEVAALFDTIVAKLIDTGVNMGHPVAARFLRRALDALNLNGRIHADLVLDGVVGDETITALRIYLARRESGVEKELRTALNALQGERYTPLAEARAANEAFNYGWLRARAIS